MNALSPGARAGIGLVAVLAGAPLVLVGVGVIKPDPGDLNAPAWLVGLCGAMFVAAGVSIAMAGLARRVARDGALPRTAPFWQRALQLSLGVFVALGFAVTATWIGFGPGEREFAATVFFFTWEGKGAALAGRIAFGAMGVLMWVLTALLARAAWRRLVGP
jgi:hypothetical protein